MTQVRSVKPVTRYALVPGLSVLLLTVLLMAASHQAAVEQLSARARSRVQQQAQMLAVQYDGALRSAQRDVRLLARSPLLRPGRPADSLRAELEFLRNQPGTFVWLGLVAPNGTVLAGTQGWLEGRSIASRPVFQHGIVGSFISDVHAPVTLKPLMIAAGMPVQEVLDIGEPVRDEHGRIVAMLAAHLGVDWVGRMRDHAIGQADGPHVMRPRVQVLGTDGQRNVIPEDDTGSEGKSRRPRDNPASADESRYFIAQAQVSRPGQPPVLPWSVRVLQARDQALAPAYRMLGTMALLGTLAAAVVATLGAWLARRVLMPWGPLFDAVLSRIDGRADARSVADAVTHLLRDSHLQSGGPEALLARLALGARDLRRVIDHLPVAVALIGKDLRIEYLNRPYTELLGWTTEQLGGRPAAHAFYDADERRNLQGVFDHFMQTPAEVAARFTALRPSGERVAVQWHLVPTFDNTGELAGAIALLHDVRQERAERARADKLAGRLRALADAALDDALATLDEAGRVLEWSRGAERLTGYPVQRALGRTMDELLSAGVVPDEMLQQVQRDGSCYIDTQVRVADGRLRWFTGTLYTVHGGDDAGRFGLLLRDSTDQREAHLGLARSEERLRLALAAASLGTWDLTFGDGPAQIRCSPGYAEALGTPAALLPTDAHQLFDRMHPDDRQAVRDAVDVTLQEGRPLAVEFRVIVGDRIKWHAVHGALVPAQDGLGMRLMGVGRDVTQRHEGEAALQDSRARLSAIVAGATDAIVSTDEHGRITLFNPAAERVFGHEGAVMLGQPLDRLLPPGVRDMHALHMTALQNSGARRRMLGLGQVQGVAADGRLIELEASVSMAVVNGQRVLTAILRDVTERMRQQQELEAARADLAQLTRRLLEQEKQTGRQLAQALHDALGQTLTALQLHWDALVRASQEQRPPLQDRVAMLVTTANQQMRGVLGELRPPMLDEFGLAAALDNEMQRQRPVKTVPSLHLLAVPRLNAQRWRGDVEYAAFMVGREALANALHHARARAIVLTLDGDEGELLLRVQDDGVGLDPALLAQAARPGRLGLVGMRERALAIGARLRIEAPASGGTIVTLYWSTNDEDLPGR